MNLTYKHIGYYNDVEDTELLFHSTADEILDHYLKGCGHFYESSNDSIIKTQYWNDDAIKKCQTRGMKYMVVKNLPCNPDILTDDDFIDIYRIIPE